MTTIRHIIIRLFLPACLCLAAHAVAQDKSTFESEPNDTPAEADAIAGAAIVLGTMSEGDQDGFMWTVSDEDAQKRWLFELHGIPGRLTIAEVVRVEFAENGVDVAGQERLMKMGTRDGYTTAVTDDLLFEPGEYLIGLAYAGGSAVPASGGGGPFRPPEGSVSFGDEGNLDVAEQEGIPSDPEPGAYRFIIREGTRLGMRPLSDRGSTRDDAYDVGPGGNYVVFETRENAWYSFDFKPQDTQQRWDLRVQVPVGRVADATLFDAGGQPLDTKRSGRRGHLVFPDIVPGETPFILQVAPKEPGFITSISSEATGQRVAGEEAEPNGRWNLANRVDLSQPLRGRVNEVHDTDHFKFTVDDTTADQLLVLRIETDADPQKIAFCLHDGDETRLQCRSEDAPIELPDLLLQPGEYGLSVVAASELNYEISLNAQGPVEPGVEIEPNDAINIATTVPANHRIKGRGNGRENDYYRFLVAEEPQLWRFQVIGEGIVEVQYLDGAGSPAASVGPAPGQRRVRLDDLFLLPGKHHIKVFAEDGAEYALLARAVGPPDPNGEREPNNDTSRMQRLAIGQTRTGLLSDEDDTDYYRFFLGNWDHVQLTVEPPPDGIVAPALSWYNNDMAHGVASEPGQVMTYSGVFPPGDYHVRLRTNQPSDAEYRLSLERLPRWSCASNCEPNGMPAYYGASPVPPTLVLEGVAGDWGDTDAYRLPVLDAPGKLIIRSEQPVLRLHFGRRRHDSEVLPYDAETGSYTTTVPAGVPMRIIVETRGAAPYRLELEFDNGPQALTEPDLSAELALALESDTVSAFRQYGQVVDGELTISNTGAGALVARLEAATSDYRWHAMPGESRISLPAGGTTSIPVEIRVPPDAWADRPVRISLRAVDETGAQAETWSEIAVDRDVRPLNAAWNWAIPDALRGGFNAAWLPFGGELVGEIPSGADSALLRDGLVFQGSWVACCHETYGWKDTRPTITLELPGDAAAPVAGIAINNFGPNWPYLNLRRATLLLSTDGQSFDEVLRFDLLPVLTEQYFALDEPVMARYAQLRLEETWGQRSGNGGVTIGEWKVILQPGHDITGGAGFNLAAPELGGHLVWDWPAAGTKPVRIIDAEKPTQGARIGRDAELEYVIGFHDDRAAQIQRIEWSNPENGSPDFALARVIVSAGMESPIGPWTRIGEFSPGHLPVTAVLEFDAPVWARFVKFTGVRQGEKGIAIAPDVIRIRERPTDDSYRSILTEWGHLNPNSFYEEQAGIPPEPELTASGNTSRDTAAPLTEGRTVSGEVALDKQSHWYRFTMPEGANTLTIAMTGQPTVRTVLALEDGAETAVPTKKLPFESKPKEHVFEAFAEPGSELWFHVYEPPRNVVFSWDTSSSVNAYLPTIYNALSAFVSQVVPGRESANFVPFGGGPLLDTWLGEPYMLQTILNDYPRRVSSSAGELALHDSTEALAPVAGTKSVVLITDAAINHYGPLWEDLWEVQPRVFGVGVGGAAPMHNDLFQDWASVNGGHYVQVKYQGELEVAFDRAATLMRRPAYYTLAVASEYREAPGPGRLRVSTTEAGQGAAVTGGAVELILDASGSMLQRMEGKRRIVIAREVLTEAVREHVPAGTPVALRVFGHTEPGTCDTELLMPLAPLDPDAAARAIAGVQAKNLAKTPIAASLAAVPGDLGDAQAAAVVLVTDGEETCEGDPAVVIESLRDSGIDVTVNIVGFAIDDAALEARFAEWAELGGGRYFSAQDQSGLSAAIEEALQVPYAVFDSSGEVVAQGLVDGEPVELERGTYRVAVKTAPQQSFEDVQVQGEDVIILNLE